MKIKTCLSVAIILALLALVSAQNRYRNQRQSSNRNRSTNRNRYRNNEPVEQGRTLGLLGPIIGLGLRGFARPLATVGLDTPYVPPSTYRPTTTSSASTQSDPYYGGYNGYNSYSGYPSYYPAYYNYYPQYRPFYTTPYFGGYRPLVYPGNYGGYPQYNYNYGQRPAYNTQRPAPVPQRPVYGQQTATNNLAVPTRAPATTTPIAGSGAANPQINNVQVANLLGQLLGQQLRPLLTQGTAAAAAAPAHDVPDEEDKRYKTRQYH